MPVLTGDTLSNGLDEVIRLHHPSLVAMTTETNRLIMSDRYEATDLVTLTGVYIFPGECTDIVLVR